MILPNIDLARGRRAYETGDAAELAVVAAELGIALDLGALRDYITRFGNGYVALCEIVLQQIYAALVEPAGFGFEHWANRTTCLVVRRDATLVIGLEQRRTSPGYDAATARAWADEPARTDDALTIAITGSIAATSPRDAASGEALLEAVIANPRDDMARLVYADWLLEQGDVRGELVRVQCELEQADLRDPRRGELRVREQALLRDHGPAMLRGIATIAEDVTLARGLVDRIAIDAGALAIHADALARAHPIQHAKVFVGSAAELAALGPIASIGRLQSLELVGRIAKRGDRGCVLQPAAVATAPMFAATEHLSLVDAIDPPDELARFVRDLVAPRLTSLAVDADRLDASALADPQILPTLRALRLRHRAPMGTATLERMAALVARPLAALAFEELLWDARTLERFLGEVLRRATTVTDLAIEGTRASDPSRAILAAPFAPRLERLSLVRDPGIAVSVIVRLLAELPNLRELAIDPQIRVDADADKLAEAFLAAPALQRVRWDRSKLGMVRTRRVLEKLDLVEADAQTGRLSLSSGLR